MDFLGIDIYLVIVIIAAIFVAAAVWFMSKNIGKASFGKKKNSAARSKKSGKEKVKPVPKKAVKKTRPASVPVPSPAPESELETEYESASEPVSESHAVVPVAVSVKEDLPESVKDKDRLSKEMEENIEITAEKISLEGIKQDEGYEDEGEDSIDASEVVYTEGNFGSDMKKLDKVPDSLDNVGTGYIKDEDIDEERAESDMQFEGTIQDKVLDLESDGEEEEKNEDEKMGGLLDIFEEEDDEDNPVTQLAAKMDDVETDSLEEIGKEISQTLFNRQ